MPTKKSKYAEPDFACPEPGCDFVGTPKSVDVHKIVHVENPDITRSWNWFAVEVMNGVESGFLDAHLKMIAEACIARNKELQSNHSTPMRDDYAPGWAEKQSLESIISGTPNGSADEDENKSAGPPMKRSQAARKSTDGKTGKRKMSRRPATATFRYTDGKLYLRSDVIGKQRIYQNTSDGLYVKVVGAGDKAIKALFVDKNGQPITDPTRLPAKYRDAKSKTGIKDPIFMGLDFISDLVSRLTPQPEPNES